MKTIIVIVVFVIVLAITTFVMEKLHDEGVKRNLRGK